MNSVRDVIHWLCRDERHLQGRGDQRPAPHGRYQDGEPITCQRRWCRCQEAAPTAELCAVAGHHRRLDACPDCLGEWAKRAEVAEQTVAGKDDEIAGWKLQCQLAERDRDHWRAHHDEQVRRKHVVQALLAKCQVENAQLRQATGAV